jgi:cytochrome c biogenesis protein CcmG, thiol:disulfide interchange protein DsbE
LPHLIELYQKYHGAGLQVVYITNEDADTAQRFAKAQKLPFPILIDADQVAANEFQADSIPTTVVLDKQGRAAGASQGFSEDLFDQIEKLSAQLLRE